MQKTHNRNRYALRPCTVIYIILVSFTFITWLIGKSSLTGLGFSLAVLGIALIKGFMIGDYYMGLRGINSIWRWVIILWLFIPGCLITWAFVSAG